MYNNKQRIYNSFENIIIPTIEMENDKAHQIKGIVIDKIDNKK